MAIGTRAASLVSGLSRDWIAGEEAKKRAEEQEKRELQKALAVERYKTQSDIYSRNSRLAEQIEATGTGAAFATTYYTGIVGMPESSVQKHLDPSTPEGKKNLEWFEKEENRKAVLQHLRGYKQPQFNLELNDPDFYEYVSSQKNQSKELASKYRSETGNPLKKFFSAKDPEAHKRQLEKMSPARKTMAETFEELGIVAPGSEAVGKPDDNITPITYYAPDGSSAVKAFTINEAKKLEEDGWSAASATVVTPSTKGPITLWNKETGESKTVRADSPIVDSLLAADWTTTKPLRPEKVRPLQAAERDQVAGFIKGLTKDIPEYRDFYLKWDEAEPEDEQKFILNAVNSKVAELKAQPEYRDDSLETLTGIAIQDISPRIAVADIPYTAGMAQKVTVLPEGTAPPNVPLAVDEVLKRDPKSGKWVVYNATTKKPLRWAE